MEIPGNGIMMKLAFAVIFIAAAAFAQDPPSGKAVPQTKAERKAALKREQAKAKADRAREKAIQREAQEAANHQSLDLSDISTACLTLERLKFRRDVNRVSVGFMWESQVDFAVTGTATNKCGMEAQIAVQAHFYDRFGTEVGVNGINAIVPANGFIPIRIEPDYCRSGNTLGGKDVCALTIYTTRVWMNSSL
jgi:hypothetical protein